jgi:hypothetical protein
MVTAMYIRNRKEASVVARIARDYGCKTSIRDVMSNDRFLLNLADRLFGADPDKTAFVREARQAVMEMRTQPR